MIRIDEIYDLVFAPWLARNRPGMRMYYFHPFGTQDIENICCHDVDACHEHNYIIFFDQEPINLARQHPVFDHIHDLQRGRGTPGMPMIVTSEQHSAEADQLCARYHARHLYYFFHGWAALDWYRGYDRCEALEPANRRRIRRTFMSPNRIIGGDRWHRVVMMYHVLRRGLNHNAISMPNICPVENEPLPCIAAKFVNRYPDIVQTFTDRDIFPMHMPGESSHPMTSYKLDLWDTVNQSMIYLVTETVAHGQRWHLTEKIFKPVALGMPFMLIGTAGSLAYLRSYGFRTFGKFWDESYDDETDIFDRIDKVMCELSRLDRLTLDAKQQLWLDMLPIIEHNHHHFYHGGFEHQLSKELYLMLQSI